MFRYMAFVWDTANPAQCQAAALLRARLESIFPEWQAVLDSSGLGVFCTKSVPGASQYYLLAHNQGAVVGTLFTRTDAPAPPFTEAETENILRSQGRRLISHYWGRYVAFLRDPKTRVVWIVKDPTGRLPCISARFQDVFLLFSALSDCKRLALCQLSLNWPYIRRRVAIGTGGAAETGLEHVSQLCGGERMEICHGQATRTVLWKPLEIAETQSITDPQLAAIEMEQTAICCAGAWLTGRERVIHRLSGGLDSSIVLGCMRKAAVPAQITCVTYFRPGGVSDERPWARLAAEKNTCILIEQPREPHLSFDKLPQMTALPRPPDDLSFLEITALERPLAAETKATAVFTGDGGDAILGSHSISFTALDYMCREGFRAELLTIASEVALLTHTSTWRVLRGALRGASQRNTTRLREARQLVNENVFSAALDERLSHQHPWFDSASVPSSISRMLPFSETGDFFYDPLLAPEEPYAEPIAPLLSQPFVETCLRIPSYLHFEGHRDRGLARRAFAAEVPPPILARHWKDRVQGFPEEVLRQGRSFIREFLLDGVLAKEKLLDARRLELALSTRNIKTSVHVGEILDHVVTEAWIRTWAASHSLRSTSAY